MTESFEPSASDESSEPPTAIVTGAAVRIGRAIALRLAASGARVAIHYHTSAAEAEQTVADCRAAGSPLAVAVPGDLAAAADCAEIVATAHRELGTPTLLVNSAAIFEPGTLESTDADSWRRHLDINLAAPLWLSQAFARVCGERSQIVNIVDWRGEDQPPGHLAYTISKTGLVGLTRLLARELAPSIRVNAIAPGPMLPPPGRDQSYLDRVAQGTLLQRSGSAGDIAEAVAYLVRATYVTGDVLHVTGGQEYFASQPEGD